jgi:hypothetical protein
VGLALGLMLKKFPSHGTKTFFSQAFLQNKKDTWNKTKFVDNHWSILLQQQKYMWNPKESKYVLA